MKPCTAPLHPRSIRPSHQASPQHENPAPRPPRSIRPSHRSPSQHQTPPPVPVPPRCPRSMRAPRPAFSSLACAVSVSPGPLGCFLLSQGPGGIPDGENPLLLRLPGACSELEGTTCSAPCISPGCVGRASRGKSRALVAFKRVCLYLSQHKSSHCTWQDLSLVANGKGFQNNVPALARPLRARNFGAWGREGATTVGRAGI